MPRARTPKPAPAEENTAPSSTAAPGPSIDASFLHTLVGYNARRASLSIIEVFVERMATHDLKMVEFSVLSLVSHNPGITDRKSTRLNSSHLVISYAVFCLKKKKNNYNYGAML